MGKPTIYTLTDSFTCDKVLKENPDYKVFWRSGYAYRGASEREILRLPLDNCPEKIKELRIYLFNNNMQKLYDWAAAIDITVDHDKKEIHFNGFSENDLY